MEWKTLRENITINFSFSYVPLLYAQLKQQFNIMTKYKTKCNRTKCNRTKYFEFHCVTRKTECTHLQNTRKDLCIRRWNEFRYYVVSTK